MEFTPFERLAADRVLQRLFLEGKNARLQDTLEILQTVAEPIVLDRPVVLIANRNSFVRDVDFTAVVVEFPSELITEFLLDGGFVFFQTQGDPFADVAGEDQRDVDLTASLIEAQCEPSFAGLTKRYDTEESGAGTISFGGTPRSSKRLSR